MSKIKSKSRLGFAGSASIRDRIFLSDKSFWIDMTPDEAMRLGKALLVASQMPVCELPVNSVLFKGRQGENSDYAGQCDHQWSAS